MKPTTCHLLLPLVAGMLFAAAQMDSAAYACSEVILPGSAPVVSARTMDFETNLASSIVVVPRHLSWTTDTPYPGNRYGLRWENKYGFVGVDLLGETGLPAIIGEKFADGMNEAGLSAAVLWLSVTEYPRPTRNPGLLSNRDLVAWVLGNFKTVDEVSDGLKKVRLWQQTLAFILDFNLHLVVHDDQGNSAVFEWVNGEIKEYREARYKGVLTNDPPYNEQSANLANFTKFTNEDPWDNQLKQYDEGGGMEPIPGDHTPKSRFGRLWTMLRFLHQTPPVLETSYTAETLQSDWKIQQGFHVMHHVDANVGECNHPADWNPMGPHFYTMWTVVRDHTNRRFYYTGARNQSPQVIDLNALDFAARRMKRIAAADDLYNPLQASLNDVGGSASATPSFGTGTVSLDISIEVPDAYDGRTGNYYIYAKTADGKLRVFDGDTWSEATWSSTLPACASGRLGTTTFHVLTDTAQSNWQGARFYAGFGRSPADMFANGKAGLVYTMD